MAYSVKTSQAPNTTELPESGTVHADKIVIVTGPSFGTGVKLVLFGAVLGAAGALYWKSQQESKKPPPTAPAPTDADSEAITERLKKLSERIKVLAGHASDAIHSVAEIAAPVVQNALHEAKEARTNTEAAIKEDLKELHENDDKPEQV